LLTRGGGRCRKVATRRSRSRGSRGVRPGARALGRLLRHADLL